MHAHTLDKYGVEKSFNFHYDTALHVGVFLPVFLKTMVQFYQPGGIMYMVRILGLVPPPNFFIEY